MKRSRDEFWKITPREFKSSLEAEGMRLQREHNERAWLAWHVVALDRAKRFPKLQTLLIKRSSPSRRQTWQQQYAVMEMWVAHTRRLATPEPKAR